MIFSALHSITMNFLIFVLLPALLVNAKDIIDANSTPMIDTNGLIGDKPKDASRPTQLVELFLEHYCKTNVSDFCILFNKCIDETSCSNDRLIDDNTNLIDTLLNQFSSVDDTKKLISLTDQLANSSFFIVIAIIVICKIVVIGAVSYLAKRFSCCKKIKTSLMRRKVEELNAEPDQELQTIIVRKSIVHA